MAEIPPFCTGSLNPYQRGLRSASHTRVDLNAIRTGCYFVPICSREDCRSKLFRFFLYPEGYHFRTLFVVLPAFNGASLSFWPCGLPSLREPRLARGRRVFMTFAKPVYLSPFVDVGPPLGARSVIFRINLPPAHFVMAARRVTSLAIVRGSFMFAMYAKMRPPIAPLRRSL